LSEFPPDYAPGTTYNYSNQAFALLGALTSHAFLGTSSVPSTWDTTYQGWSSVITDNLLSPLQLNSTGVQLANVLERVARPYDYPGKGNTSYVEANPVKWNLQSAGLGAGALSSTLGDMLNFLDMQIFPPLDNYGQAIQATQQLPPNAVSNLSMGLGWALGDGYICKDGLVSGYNSYMVAAPSSKIGIVAMANCQPSPPDQPGKGANYLGTAALNAMTALGGPTWQPFNFPQIKPKPCCPGC